MEHSIPVSICALVRYPKKKRWSLGYPFCIWISLNCMQMRWEFEFRISTTGKSKYFQNMLPIAATILYKLNVIIQIVEIFAIHDKFCLRAIVENTFK